MGLPFVSSSFQATVARLHTHILNGDKIRIITANPEIVMLTRRDTHFARVVSEVDYITPDGVGILIAGKILKKPIPERITGVELALALFQYANEHRLRIYLLGASPEVMNTTHERIISEYPNIQLRTHHGYFTEDEEAGIIAEIAEHKPHILLVGLGAPRQEIWLTENKDRLTYNIAMGVGGTFDVLSGEVRRAPLLWQRLGIEWLYRLIQEPRRFRRMLALPQFLLHVLMLRFFGSKS